MAARPIDRSISVRFSETETTVVGLMLSPLLFASVW